MTYSEMCESRTNKRRTLSERVLNNKLPRLYRIRIRVLSGTPDTPTLFCFFRHTYCSAIAITVRVTHLFRCCNTVLYYCTRRAMTP